MRSKEQRVVLGAQAEAILSLEFFDDMTGAIQEDIALNILATLPEDAGSREALYGTYNGMRAFINQLKVYKSEMEIILSPATNNEDEID